MFDSDLWCSGTKGESILIFRDSFRWLLRFGMKKPFYLGCSVFAAVVFGIFLVFVRPYLTGPCLQVEFADMASAGVEQYTYKGWLPEWMPPTAVNIQEAHDLDTSQVAMKFGLSVEDFDELSSGSRLASRDTFVPDPCSAKWWNRRAIERNVKSGSYTVYKRLNRRQNGIWFFTHDDGEVFMWHIPQGRLVRY